MCFSWCRRSTSYKRRVHVLQDRRSYYGYGIAIFFKSKKFCFTTFTKFDDKSGKTYCPVVLINWLIGFIHKVSLLVFTGTYAHTIYRYVIGILLVSPLFVQYINVVNIASCLNLMDKDISGRGSVAQQS